MFSAAQQCFHPSCSGAASDAMSRIDVARLGSSIPADSHQPRSKKLETPPHWLPAPFAGCGGSPVSEPALAGCRTGHTHYLRRFSSKASSGRPTLKTQIRELYKRVHPDRFQDHPEAQVSCVAKMRRTHKMSVDGSVQGLTV